MTRHVHPYTVETEPVAEYQRFINFPTALIELRRGVVEGPSDTTIHKDHPLVIYRFPARSDDTRTLIAAALPASGFLFSTGYAHGVEHPPGTDTELKLALLAWMNTLTCDWWVRRFVDRHVTASIINNLPLPIWAPDQIRAAARLAAALIVRGGTKFVVGEDQLESLALASDVECSSLELRARLEILAASSVGLEAKAFQIVSADFAGTEEACPSGLRSAVLDGLSPR